MKSWLKVTLLLCTFGTLREIRPSEPFVSEFLLGEWRNITEIQLSRNVYPVGTYSYLALLVVVFLITDFLRFKPIIILSGVSGIVVYATLLWTSSLEWLQANQFFYGLYMATEVAYLTYIYAKVDSDKYPQVSSYTRIAALAGRFLSGVSAQILVYYHIMDFRQLNYITFTAQILATFWAIWLPPVKFGIYFHRKTSLVTSSQYDINTPADKPIALETNKQSWRAELVCASALLARHARAAYSRTRVWAWSLLYATALALFVQAQVYVQLLWKEIQDKSQNPVMFNGGVEAISTLVGAVGAYVAGVWGGVGAAAGAAALQAGALLAAVGFGDIYASYVGYTVMCIMYHYTITLASAKIAGQLTDESCFGLIFGLNTLLGTALQSLLTLLLLSVLALSVTVHYYVLSALFAVLSVACFVGCLVGYIKKPTL